MTKQAILGFLARIVLWALPSLRTRVNDRLAKLAEGHGEWSRYWFGPDAEVGPTDALLYLSDLAIQAKQSGRGSTAFRKHLANGLILILDAARRGDINPDELLADAEAKHEANKGKEGIPPYQMRKSLDVLFAGEEALLNE